MLLRKNRAIFPQFDLHTKLESLQRPNGKNTKADFWARLSLSDWSALI